MINGFYTCIDRKMNYLMFRGYDEDGAKTYNKYKFKPTLFVENANSNSKWKSLDGIQLEPRRFDSMSQCRQFTKDYEDIRSFKIHGNDKHIPAFIQSQFPGEIKYNQSKIDIATIDIETMIGSGFPDPSRADQEITLIGLKSSRLDHYIQWGTQPYDESKSVVPHLKKEYREFATEADMFADFLEWWSDVLNCPDVITGWNTRFFDVPYIVNRIARVLDGEEAKRLSPWGTIEQRTQVIKGKEEHFFNIHGIQQLDYMELFKKFTINTYGKQESYKLDFVAEVVLGQNKIDYSDEYSSLKDLYERNYNLYVDYNLVDCELIELMEKKIGLLSLVFTLAYFGGVNYGDTLGTVAIWDSIIFRNLADQHIAVPQNKISFKTDYVGGFVKEPTVGRHDWCLSFDLNSLYPQLIIQYNMSPETIVPNMKVPGLTPGKLLASTEKGKQWSPDMELSIAANGACFKNDKQGIIPRIIEQIYAQRVTVKETMLSAESLKEETPKGSRRYNELEIEIDLASNKQMCLKILLNSLYGAMANRFFRYYNIDIAEGITMSGQYVINTVDQSLNTYLATALKDNPKKPKNRIVAADTDSVYVAIDDVVKKVKPNDIHEFCVEFAKQALEPIIEQTYEKIAIETNAFRNTMKMKLEKVSEVAIFTAPKRYILKVLSSEGVRYNEPKIVMKGIEAIKSSTPKICRDEFKTIFNLLIDADEKTLQSRVKEFQKLFDAYPTEKLAFPRGVTAVNKYASKDAPFYIKGTPINSRSSIMYNKKVHDLGLTNKYELIGNGDRIKFIFLKDRNPTKENVIGFLDKLPPEFELDHWIDLELMYTKTFVDPLQLILNAVGWKAIPVASLEDFFS